MKTSISYLAPRVTFLALLFAGANAQSATAVTPAGPIQTLKCYKSSDPLTQANNNRFQTDGLCQGSCTALGKPVMAITGGSTCYCGDEIPALDQQVAMSNCNSPCQGYGSKMCGGIGFWQVYLTGITGDVQTAPNTTSSSSSSISHAAETVVVTQPPSESASSDASSSKGPNKIGIAVGVVVGVVILAAAIGGFVFYMKQQRKREIEEEYKQQAAISSFVNANKPGESKLTTDQRLDPNVFSARRESVGSIADERDFSRRILQVRNPDNRGSLQSVA